MKAALLTDFYQLTMAQALWDAGRAEVESVFYLFFRRAPFKGSYAVFSGLNQVIDFLKDFHFTDDDISYLKNLKSNRGKPIFKNEFLKYLKNLKISVDLNSVKEGCLVFPFEPLIRVQGPIIQCQLLETSLLNLINFSTLISTKASRVKLAAGKDEVIEFGLRRAQGSDGALTASRASFVGGLNSTSNVLAGKIFGIPVRGTHAHSWVMSFPNEKASFEAYAKSMPDNCIFLVDTYSTIEGVKRATKIGKKLEKMGHKLLGVRLDSGNLSYLSKEARKILDKEGFPEAIILASGDLDEYEIERLKKLKSPIDAWGVGTKLVTAYDQPALDGVYKLGAIKDKSGKWNYKMKLTDKDEKMTLPGIIQIRRFASSKGYIRDILFNETNPPLSKNISFVDLKNRKIGSIQNNEWEDLLIPIFRKGECIYKSPNLKEIQNLTIKSLRNFPSDILRFKRPIPYPVALDKNLHDLKTTLIKKLRRKS